MEATGIVRKVDELGRIVLPKELRRGKNINQGDPIEIFVDNNSIVLHKYQPILGISDDIARLITSLSNAQEFFSDEELEAAQEAITTLQKIQEIGKK